MLDEDCDIGKLEGSVEECGVQGFADYGAAINASAGGLEKASDTIGNNTVGALDQLSAAWQQVTGGNTDR